MSLFVSFFSSSFFFFNDTATTEIYTLSLHDALPISCWRALPFSSAGARPCRSSPRLPRSRRRLRRRCRRRTRSEEHTSELQSPCNLVCRLLLEKKKNIPSSIFHPPPPQQLPRSQHVH